MDNLVDDSSISGRIYDSGTSVAFDLVGRPAIAASSSSSLGTWYVTDDDGDGFLSSSDTLEQAAGFADVRPNLAFDSLNQPVIAGNDGIFLDVNVKDPFLGWSFLSLESSLAFSADPTSVRNGSLAIDPDDGLPAVAWTDQGTGELFYAKWNSLANAWDTEFVDQASIGSELSNESLAFDPGDRHPAISYSDEMGNLFFSYHDGGSWNTQFVLNSGVLPLRTSLDFNEFGHGFPAIAFLDGFNTVNFIVDPPLAIPEPSSVLIALISVGLAMGFRRRSADAANACR